MSTLGFVYGITCSALEMVQRQTNGIDSAKLLRAPEAQKDDGTQLHFKRCPGLWLVHYKSSHSLNKATVGMYVMDHFHIGSCLRKSYYSDINSC